MDYVTLTGAKTVNGSIAQWVNHADAQNAAATILEEAESFIYRRLRHWRMITEATGVMVANQDYLLISAFTNYLEDKVLRFNGIVNNMVYSDRILRKTIEQVKAAYGYDSSGARVAQTPTIFYNNGTQLKFDSPPDLAYPYELAFYQQPAALSASNTTNWLTATYPRLVRVACLAGATEFMKDAGQGNYDRTYWETLAEGEIAVAMMESDRQQRSLEVGAIMI